MAPSDGCDGIAKYPPVSESTLTVQEMARRLRVQPATVYRLLRRGMLQGTKVGGVWRLSAAELAYDTRDATVLEASERRYRELFENADDLLYTLDLDGTLTAVNRKAEAVTGYRRDEL